ncbi:beta-1,6-N-acetylglucosaminyltransferase [Dyadobacter sp. LJ53]|uniref:beta-1,6-N-acetylglucosaminyltransferase n=1 Tax=Dyadobacter chenwenxiniae TaxID=2906456 RepID=UPI001F34305D|nr:beta-1,6-N-acetylglucosaminyltransferase [Dyadobacter chenwenxiniae]MCF0048695.1 beta-1,6-N-acetylglucosaminyltransferase [Dyadobacter chenwenxiniae]
MKIAHLILAHGQPAQLARLVRTLTHPDAYFFLHIDKKAVLPEFEAILPKENVFYVDKREKVGWGAYSIVQATINGLEAIVSSELNIGYINLLSGSDYPLKRADEIHNFFRDQNGKNFMEFLSVSHEWKEAIPRLSEYHLTDYHFSGKYFVQKWMNKLLPARKMPDNLVAVGRSQWMSITLDAAKYILTYLKAHPEVTHFFKHTWAPDEIIFQTILYNSRLRDTMVNNNLRYIRWQDGKASPEIFTAKDEQDLLNSGSLFARKFDMISHPEILDQIDKKIFSYT